MIQQYVNILSSAKNQDMSVIAVSAIAEGADTFFAEVAISLNIPLEIVRPFAKYADDFKSNDSLTRYERLCDCAVREINLPFNKRSNIAYQAAMHWIVDNSDVLIAVWDGRNTGEQGGTSDAVERAIRFKRSWIHINVAELSVDFHYSDEKENT